MNATCLCPACRARGSLIDLGTRRDRPHRWRPWATVTTHVYLCRDCAAVVTAREPCAPVPTAPRHARKPTAVRVAL